MAGWEAFEALVAKRPEPRLKSVPGLRSGYAPPDQDEFVTSLDPVDVDIDGVAIGIAYKDAAGFPTERTIRCLDAYRDKPGGRRVYIKAWCLLREDWRSFRIDRIVDVFDYTTGEVIGSGEVYFGGILGLDLSRPLSEAKARKTFADGAKVLAYIAMSDGRLDPRELEVIIAFAVARVRATSPGYPDAERLARGWIGNHVPTRQTALAALRAVWTVPAYAAEVAETLISVMLADGEALDEEMEAAWAIVKAMERADARASRSR